MLRRVPEEGKNTTEKMGEKKTKGKINTMKWICKKSYTEKKQQQRQSHQISRRRSAEQKPKTKTEKKEQTSKARSIQRYGLGHLAPNTM